MRVAVFLILSVLLLVGVGLARYDPDARRHPSSNVATTNGALTPAAALILHECAKTVLAGESTVTMDHLAQIDDCAARIRAMILAR